MRTARPSRIVQAELTRLQWELRPQLAQQQRLIQELRQAQACELIVAQNIRREDIVESDGNDRPWFGMDSEFIRWIEVMGFYDKPFAEWCGVVYPMVEFLQRKLSPTPLRLYDVINYRKEHP